MEYTLKKPIQVINRDSGEYVEKSAVNVSYKGKKGLIALKKLQDVIFQSFQASSKQASGTDVRDDQPAKDNVTADDLANMIEVTGKSEHIFSCVMDTLKHFGTINSEKLSETMQEDIDIDDLEDLYKGVLKTFLLPRITQQLNSMNS